MKKTTAVIKGIGWILASLMLASCSASLVNLSYENGQLVNRRLDLVYNAAPLNYEPVSVGEAYGYYGSIDMTLYEIPGLDKKEWLTQEYVGSITTVFYNENITLPTLEEMEPDTIYVCTGEEVTISIVTIDDTALVESLVSTFQTGTYVEWPLIDSIEVYEMKFSGDVYPHLYYNLMYGEFAEGVFLYDRNSKHCVAIGDMLEKWIPNSWEG